MQSRKSSGGKEDLGLARNAQSSFAGRKEVKNSTEKLLTTANSYGGLLMDSGHTQEEAVAALREIAPELFGDS